MQEIKLAHHDDGKQKYQSHEFGIYTKGDNDCDDILYTPVYDLENITGYGYNEEEAKNDFIMKFNHAMDILKEFQDKLNNEYTTICKVEVDYKGDIIE